MAKIIKVVSDEIMVGMDDGSIKHIPKSNLEFAPQVGDIVEVYQENDKFVVFRENTASTPTIKAQSAPVIPQTETPSQYTPPRRTGTACPKCGGFDIDIQTYQEHQGSTTVSHTSSTYKEKGHGCLWWLLFGWWWWMIDLMLWICFFPFKAIAALTRRKKYKGKSNTITHEHDNYGYRTVCTCRSCGYHWEK